MTLNHYRVSSLGIQLEETLQELLRECVIDFDLLDIIRKEFDLAMMTVLKKDVKEKPLIRGNLKHYQNCDGIWTFYISDPEIRATNYSLPININNPLKIISCDSKIIPKQMKQKKRRKIFRKKQ